MKKRFMEQYQMIRSRKKYIHYIIVLKTYMMNTIGIHYPIEIITHIIMSAYTPIQISCGADHTILLNEKNNIYVWGRNHYGQIGLGNEEVYLSPKRLRLLKDIKSVHCGWFHNVALTHIPNEIYVWGYNSYGQLGLGVGYDTMHMQITPLRLLIPVMAKSIYCGGEYTIILTNISDQMYVWGSNSNGQLGLGHYNDQYSPITTVFRKPIISISCGGYHTGMLAKGSNHLTKIYMWGCNKDGQLGLGDNKKRNVPCKLDLHKKIMSLNCGMRHTIILASNNEIYVWGDNRHVGLGLKHDGNVNLPKKLMITDTIKSIHCGTDFTIALTNHGNYYLWGWFDPVEKGFISDVPKYFISKNKDPIISINCGGDHIIALSKSGKIYGWGQNKYGQLGLGYTRNKKSPQLITFKF